MGAIPPVAISRAGWIKIEVKVDVKEKCRGQALRVWKDLTASAHLPVF